MFATGIRLSVSLVLPILAGYTFLTFLFRRSRLDIVTSLALSYGLGMGILAQWMLFLGAIGMTYSVGIIAIPLLIFSLFFAILSFRKTKKNIPGQKSDHDSPKSVTSESDTNILYRAFYIILGIYVIFNVFYVFWRALNVPIYGWDAIAIIAFKAKVFFYEKSIFNLKYFSHLQHTAYPIQVPLIQTWIALNLGVWSDQFIKIIFPFAFLSLIIISNYFLAFYTNKKWALLGTALLVSSNLLIRHGTISYRDLFLSYYLCTAIMFLILWNSKKDDAFLILAAFYAGFATFIKQEGTAYLLIYLVLLFLLFLHNRNSIKATFIKSLKFIIPSFGICLFYILYKIFTGVPPLRKMPFTFTWSHLSRIPRIFKTFAIDIFFSGNWNIIWFLLLLSIVLNFGKIKNKIEARLIFVALGMFFVLYYFLNSLLTASFYWLSGDGAVTGLARIILHFFPLAALLIIILNYPDKQSVLASESSKPSKESRHK